MSTLGLDLQIKFKINPSCFYVQRGTLIHIFFNEHDKCFTLQGPIGNFFIACDGTSSVQDILKRMCKGTSSDVPLELRNALQYLLERNCIIFAD